MNLEQPIWRKQMFKERDLVLKVSKNVDPKKWDEGKYIDFYDAIFKNREYQKKAVEISLRYLLGGEYSCLEELAKENFKNNEVIQERYSNNLDSFIRDLDLSKMLSGTIDMATGTGKSYVIYAIAVIMLAEKKVDRVLVLTPSVTIEKELTEKFKKLASDSQLNALLGVNFVPPRIINGDETIVTNCIAIENRDAIYKSQESRNSIIDSLSGKGEKTLVLNDEVHHVFYSEANQWKGFIKDDDERNIKFKYVLGFTGTAYKKRGSGEPNEYLPDVIFRYSLKTAIEQGFVKDVLYVDKTEMPINSIDRWKVILDSHEKILKDLENKCGIKPITIVVTSSKRNADAQVKRFKEFLKKEKNISEEEVNSKVLCVHSGDNVRNDYERLKYVDQYDSKVEFIFSVSMLTEGWDVKRVFQIVPDEERAFNSKLLIAQVLGRGLRKPDNWNDEWGIPQVIIFNHESWAPRVKELVDELLDFKKIITVFVEKESQYNFDLLNIRYNTKEKTSINTDKNNKFNFLEEGYVKLPTDSVHINVEAQLFGVRDAEFRDVSFGYKNEIYDIDKLAEEMHERLYDLPNDEDIEKYTSEWTKDRLKRMIEKSLEKSGNTEITRKIKNAFLSSLNVLFRKGTKYVSYEQQPYEYVDISTSELPKTSSELSMFSRDRVLFYSDKLDKNKLDDCSKIVFEQIEDEINGYKHKKVENKYYFKTPQIAIIANKNPEINWIKKLIDKDVSQHYDAFIKSTDMNFYEIEYTWRKGTHQQHGLFNPDFFIKKGNVIFVIEIKDDEQIRNPDPKNYGKYKGAIKHFETINLYNSNNNCDIIYKFLFLTPRNYNNFIDKLLADDMDGLINFNSELDVKLSCNADE